MTTDPNPLQERIARAIHLDDLQAGEAGVWGSSEYLMAWYRRNAAAILPDIAAEVRNALRAALAEPTRPEGAEELARLIAQADVGEWDCGDLADALLATGRVRVTEAES